MAMIETSKGPMDEAVLERREGTNNTETETTSWVEYWHNGELVKRSATTAMKTAAFSEAVAQNF